MKQAFRLCLLGWLCMLAAGCASGVKFSDQTLNQPPLPDDFKFRTIIKNSIEFRSDPASNIGVIIAPDTNGEYHIIGRPLLPTGITPTVAAVKDGDVYHAVVDQGASAQGNYLANTASLSADETEEIDIVDALHAYVPPTDIPDDQIFAVAATTSATPRFWLEDLYISTVSTTISTKESANASASAPAYGAKGNVYAQSSATVHDWIVAARLIDIDAYAQANGKPYNGPIDTTGSQVAQTTAVPAAASPHVGTASLLAFTQPTVAKTVRYTVLAPIIAQAQ